MMDQIQSTNPLTLIVFLALIIHKIPAALALATSLLPLIPPRKIRVHVAIFSIATPLGALLSIMLLGTVSAGTKGGTSEKQSGLWAGMALAFSGGTFLYVATVLQPVRKEDGESPSQHGRAHPGEDEVQTLGSKQRVLLIIFGMFLPIVVSSMIGHGHEHSHS
jgi:solute carrier family 39 (zinc transporter), member 9